MRKIPERVDKDVGARLKQRRKAQAMSQKALADGLGITFQQVQKYEKGTNRISASRLSEIALILNVPVSYFFDGHLVMKADDGSNAMSEIAEFTTSPDGRALVQSFSRIAGSATRRTLRLLVESLAEQESSTDREDAV